MYFYCDQFNIVPRSSSNSNKLLQWINILLVSIRVRVQVRAAERIQTPRGNRERRGPLRAKRAENVQCLEINLLLVHIMRPPDLEELAIMRRF